MTDIEQVARAIWNQQRNHWGHYRDMVPDLCEWEELTQSKQRELMREAQAAIAAMQPAPQEPVAWMYAHPDDPFPPSVRTDRHDKYDFAAMAKRGWTETPLYAHSPAPQWQGIESEAEADHAKQD